MGRRYRRRYIRCSNSVRRAARVLSTSTNYSSKRRYAATGYSNKDPMALTIVAGVFCVLCLPVGIILAIVALILWIQEKKQKEEYEASSYYIITKLPYRDVRADAGRMGEYIVYKNLQHCENTGARFLFNVYVPKKNGETTEIDVLMISKSGLFVFESKNYSGWIFGSDNQRYWHQTLPQGHGRSGKESFYNPIMQNRGHIKHLKTLVGDQLPMHSVIVFGDKCTLKRLTLQSGDYRICYNGNVASVVENLANQYPGKLTDLDVERIYSQLYPYTQADAWVRARHVANMQMHNNPQPVYNAPRPPVETQGELQ